MEDDLQSQILRNLFEKIDEFRWRKTSEEHPVKDGDEDLRDKRVLVIEKGQINILSFNHFHQCWDGEDQDDYHCDIDKIEYWMPLPLTVKELNNKK